LRVLKWLILAVVVAGLGLIAWVGAALYNYAHKPTMAESEPVIFSLAPGESFDRLAQRLQVEGIIGKTTQFKWVARLRGNDKHLKAGEYRLSAAMTPVQILDVLVSGEVFLHVATIPEGYSYKQIAAELGRLELADSRAFAELAADPATVGEFGLEGETMEGYLFPDTYYFPKGMSAKTIMAKMVERFRQQVPQAWYDRAKELGFSLHQVVILASIIEKETGDAAERELISSVFYNRLKKRMRLESDPTVIYGIPDFDGNLTRKHLGTRTPYNTYMIRGLPKGPIANPGREAIRAALYPARTDFLFFVSKKDGTHHFSKTIEEHNRAVRKYQLRRRSRRKG
jgi:UPF0755 protein